MSKAIDIKLLENASATGGWKWWPGGVGNFIAVGTFGTQTVTLQVAGDDDVQNPANATAVDVGTDAALTAAGIANFQLGPCWIRAEVAGGSGASGLYVSAKGIGLQS